jgi:hypothetical protein
MTSDNMNTPPPVPASLLRYATRRAWVCWTFMGQDRRKVPFNPTTGRAASSTDPATWGTLAEAQHLATVRAWTHPRGGVGIVSAAVPELVFLDLDRCTDTATGEPTNADAARLLEECSTTYAERTPSGAGVRIIGTAESIGATLSRNGTTPGGLALEIYKGADRYLTVTGARCPDHPDALTDIADEVLHLLAGLRGGGGAAPAEAGKDARDDAELVRRIATGEGFHHELLALAARYIGRGVSAYATADMLRGLMLAQPEAARDARWHDRFASIAELVRTAAGKYAAGAEHRRQLHRLAARLFFDGLDPDEVATEVLTEAAARGVPEHHANTILHTCAEREVLRREAAHA